MADNYIEQYNLQEGTSQRTRLEKSLLPESFQIDGRTTADLVRFAVKFSKFLIYHNPQSEDKENWKDFFIKEKLVFSYIIANTNLYNTQRSFYKAFESIIQLTDEKDIQKQLELLINPLFELFSVIITWNTKTSITDKSKIFSTDLSYLFNDLQIRADITRLYQLQKKAKWMAHKNPHWLEISKTIETYLELDTDHSNIIFQKGDVQIIKNIFEKLYRSAEKNIDEAKKSIEKHNNQNVKPHIALFFGFLKIYKVLQKHLNSITERHLNYYFEEILGINKNSKSPDQTLIQFELNEGIDSLILKKGTGVIGPKDENGAPIVFNTIRDINLTNTKIAALQTLFVSQNPFNHTGLTSKKVITDIFHQNQELKGSKPWKIFGEDQFFKAASERTMQTAETGFMVCSEILRLNEGERKIKIDFTASPKSYQSFIKLIQEVKETEQLRGDAFSRVFSTAFNLFITLDGVETKYDRFAIINNPLINGFSIRITLSSDLPLLSPPQIDTYPTQPSIETPYIKILLKDESHIYAYAFVQELEITNIKISTSIKGIRSLLMFNNYGQIDHSIPYAMFGALPKVNSFFLIGSPEVFRKQVKKFDINLEWYQLPSDSEGWAGYFKNYKSKIQNSDYKVKIEYLNSGVWEKIEPEPIHELFEEEYIENIKLKKLAPSTKITDIKLKNKPSDTNYSSELKPYTSQSRNGYLKLELISPEFGFGFDTYNTSLTETIQAKANAPKETVVNKLHPPVSPLLKNVTLNYTAEVEAIEDKGPTHTIQFYSLGANGYKQRKLVSTEKTFKLFLGFQAEGHLMIGLDSFPKDGLINFFLKMQSANVESYIREVPKPHWQYLKNNTWTSLPIDNILFDSTRGLLQSGIINIKIPDSITNTNTLLAKNLFWLRVSVNENARIFPNVLGIYTNVAQVVWDEQSDGTHLASPLAEGSFNKLQKVNPSILKIEQVFSSYFGNTDETRNNFYKRVSERLRHKDRAVTIWDYERLVLERFPQIYKTKCFSALKYKNTKGEMKDFIEPGQILLVVSPDINRPQIKNKLRPKLDINFLIIIRDYIQEISSPFIKIEVSNPYYERIRVICKVKFKGNRSSGYYISQLNNDLISYISPWIQESGEEEQFGKSLYKSEILSFINNRKYIDFVTSFSVIKTNTDKDLINMYDSARQNGDNEEIKPKFPWSILTSVPKHTITAIDNSKYLSPEARGIGNMELDTDFVIIS